ncbi:MAG: helix-turn-helix transcriptional regulator [Chloroflexi bacterium]|nr:helix-turn-helix transcriptional regulator [Chloroflexota bacterium]
MRLSPVELDRFRPLLRTLADELADPCADERPGVRAGLLLQILGLVTADVGASLQAEPAPDAQHDGGVLAAIRYLEQRYMGPITVEELAGLIGYSTTYLTRKFRQQLGISPRDYLLGLRIRRACSLLGDTRLPIASIAAEVGFRDSHYFATRFHRAMGMTPSAFRARFGTDSQTR